MESLWETVQDILILLAKVSVFVLIIRIGLIFLNVPFYIPYFDETLVGIYEKIFNSSPHIPGFKGGYY